MRLKPKYKEGETRHTTAFLWFPKKIDRELRWLEEATWEERFTFGWRKSRFEFTSQRRGWQSIRWI